ncbi:MAG: DUF502 domain-containing protein [Planctomycetes bacterium]|nr:DUF502 domain-containing protein [Planctomycetota bacterium]
MDPKEPKLVRSRWKRSFLTGLGALLPTILTIAVIAFAFGFLRDNISEPINRMTRTLLKTPPARKVLRGEFAQNYVLRGFLGWKENWLDEDFHPDDPEDPLPMFGDGTKEARVDRLVPWWFGFIIATILVFVFGLIIASYVGRQIWRAVEALLSRVPVIKTVYPYAKQISEFFFGGKKKLRYESVVAIEYPRRGIWSLGFVTGNGLNDLWGAKKRRFVTVFIPTSPTPLTGYSMMVPAEEVLPVNMSVDEAFRFIITAGVIVPPHQIPQEVLKTRKVTRPVPQREPQGQAQGEA